MVLEINRRRGVSKLMDRDPKSDRFLNARGDLLAELESVLWLTAFAREQPGGIRSAKPRRPELLNVFIDEVRQGSIELEAEIDTVLHIVVRENQPIGRVQPAGLDKVLSQLDADEIGKSNGREAEDRDRHSELRRDCGFDWRVILGRARLLHREIRQRDHLAPNAIGQHLAYQLQILLRQTLLAMLFQRDPHLVETIKFRAGRGDIVSRAMRKTFQPRSMVPVFGSAPFFADRRR